jgi:glutaredoxin 3
MVKRIAGSHELIIHDMNKPQIASRAKEYGIRMPAVVTDGQLASCCAGLGPEENILRVTLA